MTVALTQIAGDSVALPSGANRIEISGITADSREVRPGYLFAALPGTAADGARFIPQAIAAGAVAVICTPDAEVPDRAVALRTANPREMFAKAAARFYGRQPDLIVAVTGTNGKTSVAAFVRQIWERMGFRAASLGTIGVIGPSGVEYLQHTTPDPAKLHATLARLAEDHVTHLALEASSHGLSQFRLDGVRMAAGAFTNLTQDHLDYHETLEAYFAAKMRLFAELLPAGSPAVINADSPRAPQVLAIAERRGLRSYLVGEAGSDLKLLRSRQEGFGQALRLQTASGQHDILLPLAGAFQASNALVAAGLVIAAGGEENQALRALESLHGAKGRLDLAARSAQDAPIFVDYAHTPDALENALATLRPYASRKLALVFGCGGDRDRGKRPLMGAIAARLADRVIVTDDNPRSEDPAHIRAAILAAAPGAIEIADRAAAIRNAVEALGEGDVLLVAGKGHEEGQIIGKETRPFSDHDAVSAAVRGEDYHG